MRWRRETPMSTDSAAVTLAAALEPLARHLRAHPHLPNVNAHPEHPNPGVRLQVATFTHRGEPDDPDALVMWAETLPDHTITVRAINGEAYVYVAAVLEGIPVQVWTTVPGLAEQMDATGKTALTVEDLRLFATTGRLQGRAD